MKSAAGGLKRKDLDPEAEKEILEKLGAKYISLGSKEYPALLAQIYSPPKGLYIRGELPPANAPMVAVIGSRKHSDYGSSAAYQLSYELASAGVVIVSGLANGIDSVAHKAALDAGGKTIAVLASGLDICYPSNNRGLMEQIIREGGCVITEYPLRTPPLRRNFPVRNRILSGLCSAVAVIEAEAKSGTFLTVNHALEQGRDVFALPGNVTSPFSEGTNRMIAEGAGVITSAKSILDVLKYPELIIPADISAKKNISESKSEPKLQKSRPRAELAPEESELFALFGNEPVNAEYILSKTEMSAGKCMSILTMLELKGFLIKISGGRYKKSF
ncbi:MAG: DNA-processing protein DprA [Firmicutes bacterium]|nr:DNA-processing protein DprA [Bacillota bacterium]